MEYLSKQLNQEKNNGQRGKRTQGQDAAKVHSAVATDVIKKAGVGEVGKTFQSHSANSGRRNQGMGQL